MPIMPVKEKNSVDFISVELLRYRLEAICAEGGRAIERTAISPIVTDAKDYSCTLTEADGSLIAGGGKVRIHFYGATSAVRAVLAMHGDTLAPGDLFLANDPHHGCALHPQDVFLLLPVFVGDTLVAWAASSAHMLDMGGMSQGSYSPDATECFQEALRFPPVRLARAGIEQTDVWNILRNNIRMPHIVEMDMRSLAAGCNVSAAELSRIVLDIGVEQFQFAVRDLAARVEAEIRRRIAELEPGVYRAESWVEWCDETYHVPCTLTVTPETLLFDFDGASKQSLHFMNSKEFIVTSEIGADLASHFANDLPYNSGVFACIEVRCPSGSIVNCESPGPVGNAHMDVGMTAAECAIRALMMAIEASPGSSARKHLITPTPGSGYTAQIWGGTGSDGKPIYWTMSEAMAIGGCASSSRDGTDLGLHQIGQASTLEFPDVETWETWYPWRITSKRIDFGSWGAGCQRAGGRLEIAYETTDRNGLKGVAIGNRQRVPLVGFAGGYPGGTTATVIERADGSKEPIPPQYQNLTLAPGDRFICLNGGGGGWGDPLDRPAELVERDVELGNIGPGDAARDYGVIIGQGEATQVRRQEMLQERLARAVPGPKPLGWNAVPEGWLDDQDPQPICTGVEQRGGVAISTRSGAPLALAPDHWTTGCPVIRNFLSAGHGVEIIAYLDPVTGHTLFVDVVAMGTERSFETSPHRWKHWTPPSGGTAQLRARA
jgi:N-methylhydantoinase B